MGLAVQNSVPSPALNATTFSEVCGRTQRLLFPAKRLNVCLPLVGTVIVPVPTLDTSNHMPISEAAVVASSMVGRVYVRAELDEQMKSPQRAVSVIDVSSAYTCSPMPAFAYRKFSARRWMSPPACPDVPGPMD
jgi:hypothetical protein